MVSRPVAASARLSARDMRVLKLIAQFKQLTAVHVQALLFNDVSSTPVYRSLQRLTTLKYISATERLVATGGRGGSGRYIYSLTKLGHGLLFEGGEYARPRQLDLLHTLAIADCAVILRECERDGALQVTGLTTEPDCWTTVDRYNLHPDLFVTMERKGITRHIWFEIERTYKSPKQLGGKLAGYIGAYHYGTLDILPLTLFVCVYPETADKIRGLIARLPVTDREFFRSITLEELPGFLA